MRRSLWIEFFFEAFTGIFLFAVVLLCWRRPVWLSLLLAGGLGAQLWFWREKADAAVIVAAALLGTPSEILGVRLGGWTYDAPGVVLGIPIWIPLVWAYMCCFFRRISLSVHSVTRRVQSNRSVLAMKILFWVLGGAILFYCLIAVSVVLKPIAIAYIILLIPVVLFWHGERDILIFVIGAIIGTIGECTAIMAGVFHYNYPILMIMGIRIPISLPLAWGLSSVIIARIARIWETTTKKKTGL